MKRSVFLLILIFGLGHSSFAQDLPYHIKHFNLKNKVAVQGYDVVSYHKDSKAIKGKEEISHNRNGVIYWFNSKENLEIFKANPLKYEPEYGGYCAYAMAEGDKVKIDPETFKVIDGKLYLFYNFRFTNTLKLWNKEENTLLPKADQQWSKLITKK